jgi:RNA polymerase sigma factor (TIGR02999 family)
MDSPAKNRITEILTESGEERASSAQVERLFPLVYDELRQLAGRLMARERRDHTLQSTALVHEAYVRLVDQSRVDWRGTTHFRAVAAQAMRRVLIDHARARKSEKRGGEWQRVTLAHSIAPDGEAELDAAELIAVNAALEKLATLDRRQAQVVELRFFGGLSVKEAAEVLGVSQRTVEGDWAHARVWLRRELRSGRS